MRGFCMQRYKSSGFAMMIVITGLLVTSIFLMVTIPPARVERQQLREAELMFAGQAIQSAIESYAKPSGNAAIELPRNFDDLLFDTRGQVPRRHLRRVYIDPMSRSTDWGLILQDDRLLGVYSKSMAAPLKKVGFTTDHLSFTGAATYSQWRFIARIN